jgi:capsule polysaccharide export protein KpsE/RkpR
MLFSLFFKNIKTVNQVDQLLDQNAEVSILKAQVVDLIRQLSASRSTEEVNGLKDEVAMLKEKLGSVPQLPETNEVDALQAEITKLRKQLASSTKMATLSKGGKRTVSQVPVVKFECCV